jgi:hypothetical protein
VSNSAGGKTIGKGTFGGRYTIVPAPGNDGATVDDVADIQPELRAQIDAQSLPAPDANTIYAVFFPSEKLITMGGGNNLNFFCAYHRATTATSGAKIRYFVMPHSVADAPDCGVAGGFGNLTAIASHELMEGITDPDASFASAVGPPLAWYDPIVNPDQGFANGSAGDICNHQQAATVLGDGRTYVVQKIWSNQANACVVKGKPRVVSLGNGSVLEGDAKTRSMRIPLTLSAPSTIPVTVDYKVHGVTAFGATAFRTGVDFASTGGTLGRVTFAPGAVLKWITVTVHGDTAKESNETFKVSIEAVSTGYGVGRGATTATIIDDDKQSAPTAGVGDSAVSVGVWGDRQLAFPVTISRPVAQAVTARFTITGLNAVAGVDFTATATGTVTIPAGATTAFVTVNVKPNKTLPAARTLWIALSSLSAPSGTKLVRSVALGTLLTNS